MIMRTAFAVIAVATTTSACKKWIGMSGDRTPRASATKTARPEPSSDNDTTVEKGHMRVTVQLMKSETQAWFKNCLSFKIDGEVDKSVNVGCNKNQPAAQPPMPFLQQKVPYDFEVTKGGQVNISFSFETWKTKPNNPEQCITYAACSDPYPGIPTTRTITGPVQAIRCYRAGTHAYRLFYEDQPDENHTADKNIRAKLLLEGQDTPPPGFDPGAPVNLATKYRIKMPLNSKDPQEGCVQAKASGQFVTEQALQDCMGIDYYDFVVDVESADAAIRIGDFTDDRCKAL